MYCQTLILFDQAIKLGHYAFLLFFACLLDYNIHKIAKKQFHLSNKKTEHLAINLGSQIIILISIIGIAISIIHIPSSLYLKLLIVGGITTLYSLPLIIKFKPINTIKKIPFLKTCMIAFVWSYLTLNIPIEILNIDLSLSEISPLFLARFFFVAAITLPFELRDKEVDQKDGIVTLAHIFTSIQIRNIIFSLLLAMSVLMLQYSFKFGNLNLGFAYIFSGIIMAWLVQSKKHLNHQYYYKILLDGMLIFQSLLVFLISKI